MTRRNEATFVQLTAKRIAKIGIIKSSIEEPVTHRDIIAGIIKGAYQNPMY